MNSVTLIVTAMLVMALAYRYYGAFLSAKVLALDNRRITPAHTLADGQNYDSTNKWVLFGHHFAAIAGAGPLIGPVLASQFGYAPGFLWMLLGAVLAGGCTTSRSWRRRSGAAGSRWRKSRAPRSVRSPAPSARWPS
jgi:carbon starvation protein